MRPLSASRDVYIDIEQGLLTRSAPVLDALAMVLRLIYPQNAHTPMGSQSRWTDGQNRVAEALLCIRRSCDAQGGVVYVDSRPTGLLGVVLTGDDAWTVSLTQRT